MRDKRILLVNPWIEDFAAYDFWLKPGWVALVASFETSWRRSSTYRPYE